MKVKINQEGCIGCGLCEQLCPKVFRLTNEGVAEVYGEVASELEDSTKEAAESCPVSVIDINE